MTDFDRRLLSAFQVEYREHLDHIRAILAVQLESSATSGADLEECLRRAHNLKGASRAAGLRPIEIVAHRLETVFARVGRTELLLDPNVVAAANLVLDAIEDWVTDHAAGRTPVEPSHALAAIEAVLQRHGDEPSSAELVEPFRPLATDGSEAAGPPTDTAVPGAVESMRVAVGSVDRLLGSAAQMVAESLRQTLLTREISALHDAIVDMDREFGLTLRQLGRTAGLAHFQLEERLRVLTRRARQVQRLQQDSAWALQMQGRRLHEDTRRVLMVPARTVFEGFPKLMRDLGRDLGKPLDFTMRGVEVQADRRVLQALKDPLVHLLRNAISHGLESAVERAARGKPANGRVSLQVEARDGRLWVRIEDDGRGIDFRRVAHIALKRGLISETEAAADDPSDLARLLFLPGFSTSQVITEVSGRGIGLSVVQEAVSRLQGEVQVVPVEGGGTAFLLSVPLSLSLQTLLLVECQEQKYGIPAGAIERLLRISVADVTTMEGRPVIVSDSVTEPAGASGSPIPLCNLSQLLYPNAPPAPLRGQYISVVILRAGTRRLAVAVDALLDKVSGLLKDVGPLQAACLGVLGGIVLGDGAICLVLNPFDLMESFRTSQPAPLLSQAEQPVKRDERAQPCVLVVDDSFTTRTLEKGILESNGYRVRVAVDGIEALQVLRAENVDLVITDVQMPRMDGFVLLEAMKADARLSSLPVILVTSMETRADQERGLALGADAYIVKRKFEQRDLLDAVRQLL